MCSSWTRRVRCLSQTCWQCHKPRPALSCLAIRSNSTSRKGHSAAGCRGLGAWSPVEWACDNRRRPRCLPDRNTPPAPGCLRFHVGAFLRGAAYVTPRERETAAQRRRSAGGTGLRFAPVEHSGNQNESPEEVERVAASVDGLLRSGATWTNKKGETHALTLEDILIVAPYNAQVSALDRKAPRRVEGGNRGQVPRAGSSCCLLLDGNIDPGGRPEGHGIPVQPEPPERRGLACSMRGCHCRQPGSVPSAVQDSAPDRACQRILSLSGNGSASLRLSFYHDCGENLGI